MNGDKLTQAFKVNETLAAVRLFVQLNHPECPTPFTFATTFPRKVYDEVEMQAPLKALGIRCHVYLRSINIRDYSRSLVIFCLF